MYSRMLSMLNLAAIVGSLLPVVTAYTNPVIWEDLADIDIRRVGDTFYYSASTMHYSPGAPILSSKDLVNWEYIGHSVPVLDFGDADSDDADRYNLENGKRAYVNGIWASFFDYNAVQDKWYWGGCIDFQHTYMYSAPAVTGPWEQIAVLEDCYYDAGLLVDDDGSMYISYRGEGNLTMVQLSDDASSVVTSEVVYVETDDIGYVEGYRPYKRNGIYYVIGIRPSDATQWVLQAPGVLEQYTITQMLDAAGPTDGGKPHQGGLVETQNGDWHYMAFIDEYPAGRIPVLAPVTWDDNNWPVVTLVDGKFGAEYPDPLPLVPAGSPTGTDSFTDSTLSAQWEWNHNPDDSKWSTGNGLSLSTATVTYDLYSARNTLTHRILGPKSSATILLHFGDMQEGDAAGLALLRDVSGWIGIKRDGEGTNLVCMTNGITMNDDWTTASEGNADSCAEVSGDSIYLRATAEVAHGGSNIGTFAYSTDGSEFTDLGPDFALNEEWLFFMGYRYAIFNYATLELGGTVVVSEFTVEEVEVDSE